MLDDLKLIHASDPQDTLGIVERQYQELRVDFVVDQPVLEVDNVVYAGMGGSALAALITSRWLNVALPLEIVRDYELPGYVSERTYVIAASYSGNTEETISGVEQALAQGAKVAIITGGGKLAELAREHSLPLILLPKVAEPRYALLSNIRAITTLLVKAGLAPMTALEELAAATDFLKTAVQQWLPTIPAAKNYAKHIALDTIGNSVVIYAGPKLWPTAYKWKLGFNENAKQVAWTNQYPEFNHNEFMGWTQQPTQKPYAVIELRSILEHERVQKRFTISERLLSGKRPAPIVVDVQGSSLLEQLLWSAALADFVTIYTALLNGLNPAPVELVNKLKQQMEA